MGCVCVVCVMDVFNTWVDVVHVLADWGCGEGGSCGLRRLV